MGNRSLMVEIDREGNITLPEGTTLENGTYTLSYTPNGGEEREVGNFMVEEGKVGRARSKGQAVTATFLVIDLGGILDQLSQLFEEQAAPTWAQTLEGQLAYAETTYRVFGEGRACLRCGQVHTLGEVSEQGGNPQEVVDYIAKFTAHLREENVVGFLQTLLTEEQAEERSNRGYDNVEQVQSHLDRVTALLARDPLVVPSPAPATEGRTETQESAPTP